MNERIQQFAEQARTSVPAGLDTVEWIARYNEIFARLIVQECAGFLRDTLDDHFAAEQLKEHFGVEE